MNLSGAKSLHRLRVASVSSLYLPHTHTHTLRYLSHVAVSSLRPLDRRRQTPQYVSHCLTYNLQFHTLMYLFENVINIPLIKVNKCSLSFNLFI